MHRPRKFLTSTSKYLQNFRALIQESLILVTHTLMLLNGKKKLRILLQDSLRTSLNTKETQLVKLLFLLVRRLNDRSNKIDDILPGAEFPHPDFVMATRKMHALVQVHLTTANQSEIRVAYLAL